MHFLHSGAVGLVAKAAATSGHGWKVIAPNIEGIERFFRPQRQGFSQLQEPSALASAKSAPKACSASLGAAPAAGEAFAYGFAGLAGGAEPSLKSAHKTTLSVIAAKSSY